MRVYYLYFNHIIKKAVIVMLVLIIVISGVKLVYYNMFKPAVSNFQPIYQGSAGEKKIALTCNVVWGEEFVPPMLDILKKNDVKMTFFMGGKWVSDFPELTKQIAERHELGNHSYSHPHPTFISKQENISQIKRTEEAVYRETGLRTKLYAPPYGEFNKTVLEAAGESGYKTILWSIDTRDWQRPAPEVIVRRVLDKAHNGAIVLMHPTEPTVKALPTLIAELKKRGYRLTSVSEVIGLN